LEVSVENSRLASLSGNECPKGKLYAASEIENPLRILTSAVLGHGVDLKMIPVRTDKPIPKSRVFEAMKEIRRIRVDKPLAAGDIIVKNFMGLEVNLIAARSAI